MKGLIKLKLTEKGQADLLAAVPANIMQNFKGVGDKIIASHCTLAFNPDDATEKMVMGLFKNRDYIITATEVVHDPALSVLAATVVVETDGKQLTHKPNVSEKLHVTIAIKAGRTPREANLLFQDKDSVSVSLDAPIALTGEFIVESHEKKAKFSFTGPADFDAINAALRTAQDEGLSPIAFDSITAYLKAGKSIDVASEGVSFTFDPADLYTFKMRSDSFAKSVPVRLAAEEVNYLCQNQPKVMDRFMVVHGLDADTHGLQRYEQIGSALHNMQHGPSRYRRDGKTLYSTHPESVANRVLANKGSTLSAAVAFLHDTVEDTGVTQDYLTAITGSKELVAAVMEVTDINKHGVQYKKECVISAVELAKEGFAHLSTSDIGSASAFLSGRLDYAKLPRSVRRLADSAHYSRASSDGAFTKLMDITDNLDTVAGFGASFAQKLTTEYCVTVNLIHQHAVDRGDHLVAEASKNLIAHIGSRGVTLPTTEKPAELNR